MPILLTRARISEKVEGGTDGPKRFRAKRGNFFLDIPGYIRHPPLKGGMTNPEPGMTTFKYSLLYTPLLDIYFGSGYLGNDLVVYC